MEKLFLLIGTTLGGYLGWWLGSQWGLMTAFILSIVGTGGGLYLARRISRDYF
jgi:hypothetical protein